MHRAAAILAGVDHCADSTLLVAGNRGEVDFDQGATDAGIAQAPPDVVALVDIAQLDAGAVNVEAVQRMGQGDFAVDVVSAVVEHAHWFVAIGQGFQGLSPACLKGLGL
ncbi:hypothetical protein D3C86_1695070 [compost metagenome]